MRIVLLFGFVVLLAGSAAASTTIGSHVAGVALRVDAAGNAEASWFENGRRQRLLIPPRGRVVPGGRLPGKDVGRADTVKVPFAKAVRRTPDGRRWALQAWSVAGDGRVDLRFARWHGAATRLILNVEGGTLVGRATYHGSPIPRYSRTFAGTQMRVFVYLDGWSGGRWRRLFGVAPRLDGTFRRLIPESFAAYPRFRATVTGPTIGTDIAPDASVIAQNG